uniref:Selenoprotein O n=1 Tax=Arion vulgaris TaxID=1028688 RepID=A0A0B7A2E6_9EUPU
MSKILSRLCIKCYSHSPTRSNPTEILFGNQDHLRLRHRFYFTQRDCFAATPTTNLRFLGATNAFLLLIRHAVRFVHKMAGLQPTLETLNFNNLALTSLPVDPNEEKIQRQVPGACFSRVKPTPVLNPSLVCMSLPALQLLDLSDEEVRRPEFVEYFSGNKIMPGSETAAHCYCGHQFGYFSGQLGDGAAMYLGEVINKKGERWEIQLKGAGLTPYSRTADGRKVLRSSIREFLCSEAMYHLGIPTTRAGTCITSDSKVVRDIFYNGNPIQERCTLVLRIAPTFLRFGSFEIFKPTDSETGRAGPSVGRKDMLNTMLDYTIQNFYPVIWKEHSGNKAVMYVEMYKEIVRGTARLVADWQCVGWCHGVLNTDNMSIACVTIDYGPYGFMDKYDPDFICNGSDDGGRYTYKKQPEICRWNCMKLAEAIKDVVPLSETTSHLNLFDEEFGRHYKMKMRQKLGLKKELPEDGKLVENFLDTLLHTGADFTNCFRHLSKFPFPGSAHFSDERSEVLKYLLSQSSSLEELKKFNEPRMDKRQLAMFMMVAQTNPELLSALGRSSQLLEQEIHRMAKLQDLEESTEEDIHKSNKEEWNKWLDKYENRLKKEVENVDDVRELSEQRVTIMNSVNPRFILRNYIAHNAISAAEDGDYSEVRRVLKLLQSPYAESANLEDFGTLSLVNSSSDTVVSKTTDVGQAACHVDQLSYEGKPPAWAGDLRVT